MQATRPRTPANPNILLLGARRRIYLTRKLRIELKALQPNARVIGADTDFNDPLQFFVDDFVVVPSCQAGDDISVLRAELQKRQIGLIVPWNDAEIAVLNVNRSLIESSGARLLLPPAEVVSMFHDKLLTAQWARANNLWHPTTCLVSESIRYPNVVKPRFGQGSVGVTIVRNEGDDAAICEISSDDFIRQEFVDGMEYTIDVVSNRDGAIIGIAPRQRIKTRGGEVLIARLELRPELISYAQDVAARLNFCGLFNLQVIINERGICLLEFNPRFGGGTDLSIEAGLNIPRYIAEHLTYGGVVSGPAALTDGLLMTRYFESVFTISPWC